MNETSVSLKIAISSCLLGNKVRYDGTDKRLTFLDGIDVGGIKWVPFCPEVQAGMGVPRPPIFLKETQGELQAVEVDDITRDHTRELTKASQDILMSLTGVHGCILKSRSPSCAINSVVVISETDQTETGSGIFTSQLKNGFPNLPMIEESELQNTGQWQEFVQQCIQYARLKS